MPKKIIILLVVIIVGSILYGLFDAMGISPGSLTLTRLMTLSMRIEEYVEINKKIPDDLKDLPTTKGRRDITIDGWGNEIQYIIQDDGTAILKSFGKDGVPGGGGQNADMIETFDPQQETYTRFIILKMRLVEYVETNKEYPNELIDLPLKWEKTPFINDGWGNEIQYSVQEDGLVTLKSFGKDGIPGGDGQDADILEIFSQKYYYDAETTYLRIGDIERQIRKYVSVNNELPADLNELSLNDNTLNDAWGNRIQYDVQDGGIVLSSLGKDGKLGGKGLDKDLGVTY